MFFGKTLGNTIFIFIIHEIKNQIKSSQHFKMKTLY